MSATVEIHHLMYQELHTLSMTDLTDQLALKMLVDSPIKQSIDVDSALLCTAKETKSLFLLLMDRGPLRSKDTLEEGWANIINAAKELKLRGWYVHVGTKYQSNLMDAWKATSNVNGHWFLQGEVTVKSMTNRQTMTLDIMRIDGTDYLLTTGGFIKMSTHTRVGG